MQGRVPSLVDGDGDGGVLGWVAYLTSAARCPLPAAAASAWGEIVGRRK